MKIIQSDKEQNCYFVESNYGLMLLDTGAATSQLLRSTKTDQLEKLDQVHSRGLMGEIIQDRVIVPELTVSDIKENNLTMTIDDFVGLLGMDVLKNYSFSLDIKNKEIKLIDRFKSNIPCYFDKGSHIYIKVIIKDYEFYALLDTGASMSLIDEKLCRKLFNGENNYRKEKGEDWTGSTFETQIAMIDSLKIGDVLFPPHEFALMDLSHLINDNGNLVSAIIGISTLINNKFCFNLIDGFIAIE